MFCPKCGKEVSEGQIFCQYCGARLVEEAFPAAEASTSQLSTREKTPWEDREARGFFNGLFATMREVLLRPSEFFKKMPLTGGLTDPLLYGLIIGMVGLMVSYMWQLAFKGAMNDMMPGMHAGTGQQFFHGAGIAVLAFFTPFLIILGLFLSSGVLHLFLMMVKGARQSFEATFRVVAYGYSPNIFLVLPFCGGIIAAVWGIVLAIIGLREAHEITGGKAAFAVFLPVIVCCGMITIAAAAFMSLVAASFGSLMRF